MRREELEAARKRLEHRRQELVTLIQGGNDRLVGEGGKRIWVLGIGPVFKEDEGWG